MGISEFILRCDDFCRARRVSRVWLSKRLLGDTYRLEKLAAGEVDIGVRRLERAIADLAALEQEDQVVSHGAPATSVGFEAASADSECEVAS